jgi:hypothetical protein|tara:strand:- start:53 stop:766 length:714 start_codon:yes stop_codon:yes gene_type:complete
MNKWVSILIPSVLSVVIIIAGIFLLQQTDELTETKSQVVILEGEVFILEGNVRNLETRLTESTIEISTLEGTISTLQTEKDGAEARGLTLQTELTKANDDITEAIANLAEAQEDSTARQAIISRLSDELNFVKDPRNFKSLEELEDWLAEDDTDSNLRYDEIPSTEIAFILQIKALRSGYLLPAWFEDFDMDGALDYVGNLAYIGTEIYYIWAEDDIIFLMITTDVPLIADHPLPLD